MLDDIEKDYINNEASDELDDIDDMDLLLDEMDGLAISSQVKANYQDYLFLRLANSTLLKIFNRALDEILATDHLDKQAEAINEFNQIVERIEEDIFKEKNWSKDRIHCTIEYQIAAFKNLFEQLHLDDSFIYLLALTLLLYPENISSIIGNDDYDSEAEKKSVQENGEHLKTSLPGLAQLKESKPAELPRQLLAELSTNLSAH